MRGILFNGLTSMILSGFSIFAALPSTPNYTLQSFGFGSGGGSTSTGNYSLEGITGELSGQSASTTNYGSLPGYIETQQANVPIITISNPGNNYDKLKFVLDAQSNPSDALFAIQVSTSSNFSSNVTYVTPSDTLTANLTTIDYQTYASWGGSTGQNIIGLSPNTTYYVHARATQGQFSESAWGPVSNASTVGQQLSYCVYTNANCAAAGSAVAFGGLTAGAISASPTNIGVDFATNADLGGNVYIYSQNGGLTSVSNAYTIASATADLSTASSGYGAQVASVSQTSGGPLAGVSPYNGTGNNVGALSTSIQSILTSANPINGGSAAVKLLVLPSSTAPDANDYSDTLTLIAAASF
ncbi:MAG TPA: hypothetical protein VFN31_02700 [Candidatus Saccharimonadales bacterium]|nr:hypothetical protein [Candidatus Saccharimonadales bacterium]